jgi:hypothetical protein
LIKELKLRGIKDYENANKFLEEEFWPWYNSRYGREAESVYRELPEGINLDLIFTVRERRKVNKDNTIRFKGRIINYCRRMVLVDLQGNGLKFARTHGGGC